MQIKKNIVENYVVFSIIGELDASSSIQMDDAIKAALMDNQYKILIDCSNLAYISSAGLGVFVSNIGDIKNNNGELIFCNVGDSILSVFQILGLDKIVPICDTQESAKKLFKKVSAN